MHWLNGSPVDPRFMSSAGGKYLNEGSTAADVQNMVIRYALVEVRLDRKVFC